MTHLDDRLGEDAARAADTISALAAVSDDVSELHWGERRFRGSLAELTVTETAFRDDVEPIAATIRLAFDVTPDEAHAVSITVAGEKWRQVPDLDRAGPNDPVYELRLEDGGSLHVRFGDGRNGARPPAGDIVVRARYGVGGGNAGR